MTVFKIFIVATALLFCPSLGAGYNCTQKGHWKTRNNGRTEYRNNFNTGNQNALNFADMARAPSEVALLL